MLQDYSRRQPCCVILAVCSKNDVANAIEPFESHPDMLLKRRDIASFMADWQDKASNLRSIAHCLSIGLDALVFVDGHCRLPAGAGNDSAAPFVRPHRAAMDRAADQQDQPVQSTCRSGVMPRACSP